MTNPNYLGVYSLPEGRDIILTIKSVGQELVMGADGGKEQCVVMHFQEPVKPFICNKTNLKQITKLLKTPYVEQWSGNKIQIGSEKVKAFGDVVDALRVRSKLPQVQTDTAAKCEDCGNEIKSEGNLTSNQVAAWRKKKYGKALCSSCAEAMAKAGENQ
jgi:hypothetical protein